MKSLIVIILPCFLLVHACHLRQTDTNTQSEKKIAQVEKIDFEKQVLPVMIKNCSPCHFTGGKMYERLPFDKDTTIINHGEAIMKRIKDDKENKLLKEFLLENKNEIGQTAHED